VPDREAVTWVGLPVGSEPFDLLWICDALS